MSATVCAVCRHEKSRIPLCHLQHTIHYVHIWFAAEHAMATIQNSFSSTCAFAAAIQHLIRSRMGNWMWCNTFLRGISGDKSVRHCIFIFVCGPRREHSPSKWFPFDPFWTPIKLNEVENARFSRSIYYAQTILQCVVQ